MAAAISCSDWGEREVFEGCGLGAVEKVHIVPAEAGEYHVEVIATQRYSIASQADWLTAPTSSQDRDGFNINLEANDGVARAAKICLAIEKENMYDTLEIRQKGLIVPEIAVSQGRISLKGSQSGTLTTPVSINVPVNEVSFQIEYLSSSADWISNVGLTAESLSFDYSANTAETGRKARVTLTFIDGWGEKVETDIYIHQQNLNDTDGENMTLAQLRAHLDSKGANMTGIPVDSDICIEGLVVSNRETGNSGDNTQIDETHIDYSVCRRTIYLQSIDGEYGLRLETVSEKDNTFNMGDRIRLNLAEATAHKSGISGEDIPVFYYLTGVNGGMVMEHTAGNAESIPAKVKTMSSLTDKDIFTYVTLTDCEFPIRKGSLTPINEAFTKVAGEDKCAKFPILLRDKDGKSMYIYTNTTCSYRRDGKILPYGSGSMSGVIVHEPYTRFEYNRSTRYGNIGRYQLRHTSENDFKGMAKTMEDGSFSEILCEWAYITGSYQDQHYATYDANMGSFDAFFTSSFKYAKDNETYIKDGRAGKLAYTLYNDFSYLGPVGVTGNVNGLGVTLADYTYWMGADYAGENSSYAEKINQDGYGTVPVGAGSGWCTNITKFNKVPQSLNIVFSTENVRTDKISLQVSMMNDYYEPSTKIPGPRYWSLSWSTDNKIWTTLVDKFSVPDYLQSGLSQTWQTAGFKPMDFDLSEAKLSGYETVYLRLLPWANAEGLIEAGSRADYNDPGSTSTANGSYRTCWNYISVRYNK